MKKYLKLLRVKHYVKNVLVLAPLIFNRSLFNAEKFTNAIIGFFVFCAVSSAIYIINDIADVEKDRQHPTKRFRPIASGEITISKAYLTAMICLVLALVLQYLQGSLINILYPLLYLILNIAYSKGLKNLPVIDIVILSSGFLLRMIYGAAVTRIVVSGWLYLTVIAGSFYLGLGKRRNEMQKSQNSGNTRVVLRHYTYSFLDKNMYVFLALTNAFYALWAIGMKSQYALWTVPVVMIIFMKYSLDIEGDSDGDPVEVVTHDMTLILLILLYGLLTMAIIYLGR